LIKGMTDESKRYVSSVVKLDSDWVEQNFNENFLRCVRELPEKCKRTFIEIPAGDQDTEVKEDAKDKYVLSIPVRFQQPGDGRSCAPGSLASAMHYLGYNEMAVDVWTYGRMIVNDEVPGQIYRLLQSIVDRIFSGKSVSNIHAAFRQCYQPRKVEIGMPKNTFFASVTPESIYWVIITCDCLCRRIYF
jgi:hypothetical protein